MQGQLLLPAPQLKEEGVLTHLHHNNRAGPTLGEALLTLLWPSRRSRRARPDLRGRKGGGEVSVQVRAVVRAKLPVPSPHGRLRRRILGGLSAAVRRTEVRGGARSGIKQASRTAPACCRRPTGRTRSSASVSLKRSIPPESTSKPKS